MKKFIFGLCLGVAAIALADKTITITQASATLINVTLAKLSNGDIEATVCGYANDSGGNRAAQECYTTILSGQTLTDANTFLTRARTFWINQKGL